MAGSGRTTIGLFLNNFYNEYAIRVWSGAAKAADELGIALISYMDNSIDDVDPAVRGRKSLFGLADPRALDGIIVLPPSIIDNAGKERFALFLETFSSLPAVHVGVEDEALTRVVAENRIGMRELIDHLIERHGRTRIAFIRGPEGVSDAEERFTAYRDSLQTHGIPFRSSLVIPGDFRREAGTAAAICLMEAKENFDALVGANDYMALYAMKELQRCGIHVPDDVAVAGFDDFWGARSSVPALCSVRQPMEELGAEALRLVVATMCGGFATPKRYTFPTSLVPRRSCGCLSIGEAKKDIPRARDILIDPSSYEALATALRGQSEAKFRALLEDSVVAAHDRGMPVSAWQDLVPGLTRDLPAPTKWDTERSIIRFLSVLQDEIASRALFVSKEEESVFDELSGRLIGSFDAKTVREYLNSEFSERGSFFCLSLFANDGAAEVFFCTDKSLEGASFAPPLLVPSGPASLELCSDFLVLPLGYRDEILGFIVCAARGRQPLFFETLRERLGGALQGARLVASIREHNAILERMVEKRTSELARTLEELSASNEKLERLSSIDELTDLYNRRGFFDLAGKQFEIAKRRGSDLFLLYADIDSLKQINDIHGHAEGDEAIKAVATVLRKAFRQTDVVARLGGDEFTVLVIDCTIKEYGLILKRARALLDAYNAHSGKPYKVSFSVGASPTTGKRDKGLDGLMAEADARLYEAKRARRGGEPANARSERPELDGDSESHEGKTE
jgi:diguanylate cyclase (GGDEF)-like protein